MKIIKKYTNAAKNNNFEALGGFPWKIPQIL